MAITPENPNSILEPTAISGEADSAIAAPVTVTPEADSGISTPVTVTPEADSSISTPNSVTPKADSAIATPVTVSSQATVNPATPSVIAPLAPAVINRALTPLFNFNAALGLPDSVTYSRSSSASYIETYKDPLGRYAKRLTNDYVGSVTNLALYSEQFDNAVWLKTDVTVVRKQDQYYMIEGLSPTEHRVDQELIAGLNSSYTITAKAYKSGRGIAIRLGNNFAVVFDLVNGVIKSNPSQVQGSIKYVGEGFYECTSYNPEPSNTTARINLTDSTGSLFYQGNGSSGVIFKKAQLTISDKPLPYVKTLDTSESKTFTANPRYEEKGLLVEGASTNLLTNSENIGLNTWSLNGSPVITANAGLALDGSFSANRFQTTGSGSGSFQGFSTTIGTTYTMSVYLKNFNNQTVELGINGIAVSARFNTITGLITSISVDTLNPRIEFVENGWARCSISFVAVAASSAAILYGSLDGDYLIWGAQAEALPFATSYIRTESTIVSRALDDVSVALSNQDSGTILVESALLGSSENLPDGRLNYSFHSGVATNRIISHNRSGGTGGIFAIASGSQVSAINPAVSENQELTTTVVTYENKNLLLYASGLLVAQSASMPLGKNFTALSIGSTLSNASFLNGHIKRLEVYDLALTANEVKAL